MRQVGRDFLLQFHQFIQALLLDFLRNLIFIMLGRIGALFFRIGKCTHTIETCRTDKFHQFLKILLRFTRMTYHQCSTQMNARHLLTELLYQLIGFCLRHMATHLLQHVIADMLQGNVHILTYVIVFTHHAEQIFREMSGISIMQTNPFHTRDMCHLFYQIRQHLFFIQIHSVIGQFLCNDLKFFHPFGNQQAHFVQNFFHRTRHMFTGNDRNGAIRTLAVATF